MNNNYFQGRPITEGVQCAPTTEEIAKEMQDEFNASCEYTHKVRESVAFDENGKYYVHPKNGQRVYFTHVSELPTWDNEYPEKRHVPTWDKGKHTTRPKFAGESDRKRTRAATYLQGRHTDRGGSKGLHNAKDTLRTWRHLARCILFIAQYQRTEAKRKY